MPADLRKFAVPFGDALRAFRKERGLTQEKLAEKANLSPRHISSLECGKSRVELPTIFRLSWGLGIEAAELIAKTAEKVTR